MNPPLEKGLKLLFIFDAIFLVEQEFVCGFFDTHKRIVDVGGWSNI
jgi:hypothetical protein